MTPGVEAGRFSQSIQRTCQLAGIGGVCGVRQVSAGLFCNAQPDR